MAPVVELADVSVVRGGATLLDSISWTIDESDRWVVIGPNGAGKTTLLQILSANLHPSAGMAGILDEVLGAEADGHRDGCRGCAGSHRPVWSAGGQPLRRGRRCVVLLELAG